MDNAALLSEITNDPEHLGYSGKTAQQQADLLNAQNIITYPLVSSVDVASYLETTISHKTTDPSQPLSLYNILSLTYRDNTYSAPVRAYAENIIDLAGAVDRKIALHNNPLYQFAVAALVSSTPQVWNQAEADGLMNFGVVNMSRAEALWGDGTVVTEVQIAVAELQPKVDSLDSLTRQARDGFNKVLLSLGELRATAVGGTDVTVPAWSDEVTLFGTGVDAGGLP